jgi:hypothetical protein
MKVLQLLKFILLFELCFASVLKAQKVTDVKYTVSGYVKDASDGEVLIGSTILVKGEGKGTATNIYGFYSISLSPGTYTFLYSFIGYNPEERIIQLSANTTLNIELGVGSKALEEIIVSSEKLNSNIVKPEMSVTRLEMKNIQRIPALFGEVDIIKAIQMLPGVQSTAEGSSGFSVRGGSADQNLFQLDEATIYNASHFLGFFSVFNNDAIKDVRLYKGDIPASSGGRLSSLLDVRMKDGNSKKLEGTGGIGTISSRFTLEGPIIKDVSSFIVSGRRTYIDLFFPLLKNKDIKDTRIYFYDLTTKINYTINENNRIYISGYFGRDILKYTTAGFGYGNQTLTLRWNHLFSKKLFLNTSAIFSKYDYYLGSKMNDASSFKWESDMKDYSLKFNFNYYLNPANSIQFGLQSTYHRFNPGIARGEGSQSLMNEIKIPDNYAIEHGLYAMNEQIITPELTVKYGIRLSVFQNIGKATVFHYDNKYNSTGSTIYDSGDLFNTYAKLEPRVGVTYAFNQSNSIKSSYSRTFQYVQQASNSQGGTPLDIWFPASPNVKPQRSDQFAIGYFNNSKDNTIESSAEVYYKKLYNVVDFKEFANLLLNEKLDGELRIGKGRAYGLELMSRINHKNLGGWISYTYSRTFRTIPTIENGREYRAPYDKPHNISIVFSYDMSSRITLSANWLYSTGQPFTAPVGRAEILGSLIPFYSQRNGERYPDYHRLDLAISIKPKKNQNRLWKGEWNISIYNVYNRKNAWAINFIQDPDNGNITYAEKTYLFPIIPSVNYNFKF